MGSRKVAWLLLALSACAPDRVPGDGGADRTVLDELERVRLFRGRLGRGGTLVRSSRGLHRMQRPSLSSSVLLGGPLDVVLPTSPGGSLHIGVLGNPDVFVELEEEDAATGSLEVAGAAAILHDLARRTDVVRVVEERSFEEIRVHREARAEIAVRFRVGRGPGVSAVRERGGVIEVLDRRGFVRIATERAFAVDAHGVQRDVAQHLFGDRLVVELDARGLVAPIYVDPVWTTKGAMSTPRIRAQATALASGRILVTGGMTSATGGYLSSAEVFDPVTGSFAVVSSMGSPRARHSATLLPSGKVLVVGGSMSGGGATTTCEIFDPDAGTFTPTAALPTAVVAHTAIVLQDGNVLVSGGTGYASAHIYSTVSGSWESVASMSRARESHGTLLLPNGRVLVVGGERIAGFGSGTSTTEIFDPTTKTWSAGPFTGAPRYGDGVAVLPSGKAYFVGSGDGAEIYDPGTGVFTRASTSPFPTRQFPAVLPVGSGRVLAAGGTQIDPAGLSFAAVFHPSGASESVSPMHEERGSMAFAPLPLGQALIVGGAHIEAGVRVVSSTAEVFALLAPGVPCTGNAECLAGACVDGVCCDTSCRGQCQACDVVGKVGTCSPVSGSAPHGARMACPAPSHVCDAGACSPKCANDDECASDHYCDAAVCVPVKARGTACTRARQCPIEACVDGVCCDFPCDGQCEACDVLGFIGTCVAVAGPPHGARTSCAAVANAPCQTRVCDGRDPFACKSWVAAETVCRPATCEGTARTSEARCDGAGACPPPDTAPCAGFFACAADGKSCRTTCTTSTDCGDGHDCAAGKCVPRPDATCPDGQISIARDGARTDCSPYRCRADGKCATGDCRTALECAQGFVCTSSATCEAPPPPPHTGGCAYRTSRTPAGALLVGLLALSLLRLRARARST